MPYTALQPLFESLVSEPHAFLQTEQAHAKGLLRTDFIIGQVRARHVAGQRAAGSGACRGARLAGGHGQDPPCVSSP